MTEKNIVDPIGQKVAEFSEFGYQPKWDCGTPFCSTACSAYTGTICRLTNGRPDTYCSMAIHDMAGLIEKLTTQPKPSITRFVTLED